MRIYNYIYTYINIYIYTYNYIYIYIHGMFNKFSSFQWRNAASVRSRVASPWQLGGVPCFSKEAWRWTKSCHDLWAGGYTTIYTYLHYTSCLGCSQHSLTTTWYGKRYFRQNQWCFQSSCCYIFKSLLGMEQFIEAKWTTDSCGLVQCEAPVR